MSGQPQWWYWENQEGELEVRHRCQQSQYAAPVDPDDRKYSVSEAVGYGKMFKCHGCHTVLFVEYRKRGFTQPVLQNPPHQQG